MAGKLLTLGIVNQLGNDPKLNVNVQLRAPDSKAPVTPPFFDENRTFHFELAPPETDERHIELGKFMDSWSELESAISNLLSKILSTDLSHMPVLMNSLGTRGQTDVISVIGAEMFSEPSATELAKLVEQIRTNNTRRNNIVHGRWVTEVLLRLHGATPAVVYKIYRAYTPSNVSEASLSREFKNAKEREKYYFSLPRIRSISESIENLAAALSTFTIKHFGY